MGGGHPDDALAIGSCAGQVGRAFLRLVGMLKGLPFRTLDLSESTSTMPADASLDVGVDEGPGAEAELADVDASYPYSAASAATAALDP